VPPPNPSRNKENRNFKTEKWKTGISSQPIHFLVSHFPVFPKDYMKTLQHSTQVSIEKKMKEKKIFVHFPFPHLLFFKKHLPYVAARPRYAQA
jgi:hypothetical protein